MKAARCIVAIGAVALAMPTSPAAETNETLWQRLATDLSGPASATQVLTRWCARLGLADPPVIHAERVTGVAKLPDGDTRQSLSLQPGETLGYRRVRLVCGDRTLSEADNWYVPQRLTPDMNRQLDNTDTPFGAVVAPLSFHRRTLEITPLAGADDLLRVRAVLVSGAGAPFSVVVETYSRALTLPRQQGR